MIIVDGDHDDATVDQIVTQVDTWVQGENGSLAKTDKWGSEDSPTKSITRPKDITLFLK